MKLVDLTQPMSPNTPRSSDHPEVQFPVVRWYSRHGVKTRTVVASLHSGTHVDAPCLYDPHGLTIDQLPLEKLGGTAVVLDVSGAPHSVISAERLAAARPEVQPDDIVVLWTGWSKHFGDEETYVLKAPGLSKSGVDWLVERKVKAVCSDSPSPEHIFMRSRQWRELRPDIFGGMDIDSEAFPRSYGHKTLLPKGIMMVEGLSTAVEQFIGQRINILALTPKYVGVEGAPARVVAITEFP